MAAVSVETAHPPRTTLGTGSPWPPRRVAGQALRIVGSSVSKLVRCPLVSLGWSAWPWAALETERDAIGRAGAGVGEHSVTNGVLGLLFRLRAVYGSRRMVDGQKAERGEESGQVPGDSVLCVLSAR